VAAIRRRAALDVGVKVVFEGAAPGYRLEKTAGRAAEKTAISAEATLDERRGGRRKGEEGGWVERVLEEVRREFSGLPVYVSVEEGYVKRTAPMDQEQFKRYLETCRRLGFRFDRGSSRWRSYSHLQRYKPATAGRTPFMHRLAEAVAKYLCRHRTSACSVSRPAQTRRSGGCERRGGEEAVYALRERGWFDKYGRRRLLTGQAC
jgi:hypothetical protein